MTIQEITLSIENWAPLILQESYDNAGLICGNGFTEATGALVCLDITEQVIDEAVKHNINLIIAHHPIIFKGIKSLTGKNYVERTVIKAIKNDIALYAAHTNLDNIHQGVNKIIGDKLGIKNPQILSPKANQLLKLVTYAPHKNAEAIKGALFLAGAGQIGNYDSCSFTSLGEGTFRANEEANPYIGHQNELHKEPETKIEVILSKHLQSKVLKTLLTTHPYEEVAYEFYQIENSHPQVGSGMIGELSEPVEFKDFLDSIKSTFNLKVLRHTPKVHDHIRRVAWCGGAGSFLLGSAKRQKADIFITGDFKYHEFFDAENEVVIADIGHYESEQFTMDLIVDFLNRNFPKFAVRLTGVNTNPVIYY